jgi:hypothetical protein
MKPWDAASLSPWNAVRLIVSLTNDDGEQLADLLVDESAVTRRALVLSRRKNNKRANKAVRPAQRLLEEWGAKGKLTAYGYVGPPSDDRKLLEPHHWTGRQINYKTGALTVYGDTSIRSILIEAAGVRDLCEALHPRASKRADRPPAQVGAKTKAVLKACKALWAGEIPNHLPAAERNNKIREWCKENGGPSSVVDRTIERALKGKSSRD